MSDFWVFGYGSLIWKPGFEFLDEQKACLHGWQRSLCIHSWVHRGTRENPGLVLGLKSGGSCEGIARLVAAEKRDPVIAYLRERELVTDVYQERWAEIELKDGSRKQALVYVADETHEQFAPDMEDEELIAIISKARGASGINSDYVTSTVSALKKLAIQDERLERLAERLNSQSTTS